VALALVLGGGSVVPGAPNPIRHGVTPTSVVFDCDKTNGGKAVRGRGGSQRKSADGHVEVYEDTSPSLIAHSHVVIADHIAVEALSPTAVLSLPKLLSIIDAVPTAVLEFASVPAPTRLVRARLLRQPRC